MPKPAWRFEFTDENNLEHVVEVSIGAEEQTMQSFLLCYARAFPERVKNLVLYKEWMGVRQQLTGRITSPHVDYRA